MSGKEKKFPPAKEHRLILLITEGLYQVLQNEAFLLYKYHIWRLSGSNYRFHRKHPHWKKTYEVQYNCKEPYQCLAASSRNADGPESLRRCRKIPDGICHLRCLINIVLGRTIKSAGRCGIIRINISDHQMSDHVELSSDQPLK